MQMVHSSLTINEAAVDPLPGKSPEDLNRHIAGYLAVYNEVRPHEALDFARPLDRLPAPAERRPPRAHDRAPLMTPVSGRTRPPLQRRTGRRVKPRPNPARRQLDATGRAPLLEPSATLQRAKLSHFLDVRAAMWGRCAG